MKIHRIYPMTALAAVVFSMAVFAQTTSFKYQGSLSEGGIAANGTFQMQFRLFDAMSGGTQIGTTLTDIPVTATNGVVTVALDFGAGAFNGANRWLEIAVRRNSGQPYTTLSPREQVAASPYAIRTISASVSDSLSGSCIGCVQDAHISSVSGPKVTGTVANATNAAQLGGLVANQYVQTSDARLSDARNPLPGSSNYVQNQSAAPQMSASFNISGNGTIGGNLGIGTSSPQSRVGVQTADDAYGLTHTNGPVTVGSYIGASAGWFGTRSNHPLHFFTNDSLQQMTLATNGNFGIGTGSPGQRLQVDAGNVLVRGPNNFTANGDRASLYFGSIDHYISSVRGAGIRIGTFGAGDAITVAQSSGNVGIGLTNPGRKLEVNGQIATTSSTTDCPSGWFCAIHTWDVSLSSILYSGLVQRSDARLKRNIRPLDSVTSKLLELTGVSYEWKEGKPGTQYGFIAQDVERVLPDLVTSDQRGYKGVDYIALIPFTVEAIKAQQNQIRDLELKLFKLETSPTCAAHGSKATGLLDRLRR